MAHDPGQLVVMYIESATLRPTVCGVLIFKSSHKQAHTLLLDVSKVSIPLIFLW